MVWNWLFQTQDQTYTIVCGFQNLRKTQYLSYEVVNLISFSANIHETLTFLRNHHYLGWCTTCSDYYRLNWSASLTELKSLMEVAITVWFVSKQDLINGPNAFLPKTREIPRAHSSKILRKGFVGILLDDSSVTQDRRKPQSLRKTNSQMRDLWSGSWPQTHKNRKEWPHHSITRGPNRQQAGSHSFQF